MTKHRYQTIIQVVEARAGRNPMNLNSYPIEIRDWPIEGHLFKCFGLWVRAEGRLFAVDYLEKTYEVEPTFTDHGLINKVFEHLKKKYPETVEQFSNQLKNVA